MHQGFSLRCRRGVQISAVFPSVLLNLFTAPFTQCRLGPGTGLRGQERQAWLILLIRLGVGRLPVQFVGGRDRRRISKPASPCASYIQAIGLPALSGAVTVSRPNFCESV